MERQSRFTLLVKVRNKETATVVAALTRHVRTLPTALRRSLTWDRGLELAQHAAFTASECLRVGLTSSRKLAIKCAGDLGFSLDEPMQGTLIAILTYAGGHRHCLTFGGDVVVDDPGRFVAKNALPEVCPD